MAPVPQRAPPRRKSREPMGTYMTKLKKSLKIEPPSRPRLAAAPICRRRPLGAGHSAPAA